MPDKPRQEELSRHTRTIEIKLIVPKSERVENAVKKTSENAQKLWRKRIIRIISTVIFVIAVAVTTVLFLSQRSQQATTTTTPTIAEEDKRAKTPTFTTVLPSGKTINDLGGWTRASPVGANPVFVYVDYIGDARINVNQQPLPEDFKTDTEMKVEELAIGYKATEKLTVGNLIVHIASTSQGPQTAIFTKNDLLILLRSNTAISSDSWISYINSLQ